MGFNRITEHLPKRKTSPGLLAQLLKRVALMELRYLMMEARIKELERARREQ